MFPKRFFRALIFRPLVKFALSWFMRSSSLLIGSSIFSFLLIEVLVFWHVVIGTRYMYFKKKWWHKKPPIQVTNAYRKPSVLTSMLFCTLITSLALGFSRFSALPVSCIHGFSWIRCQGTMVSRRDSRQLWCACKNFPVQHKRRRARDTRKSEEEKT